MAREMLIAAAAAEWKVPAGELKVDKGVITHSSGKKTTYGAVAAAAAQLEPPKEVKLKDPKDWKIAGKPIKRLDTLDKVTGKQLYGIDFTMPGMLVATVRACPVIGGKLKSFDAAKVEKMPGVKKVVAIDGNAVVVVADTYWNATHRARSAPHRLGHRQAGRGPDRDHQRHAEGRPRRQRSLRRQQGGRRQGRDRRGGQEGRRRPTASPTSTTSPWSR